jgi:hypothetical protein
MENDLEKQTPRKLGHLKTSFLDKFMTYVEKQPISYWLIYLVLFLLQITMIHILGWITGWLPSYTFSSILFLFPIWQWVPLAIMTYSNSVSRQAVDTFKPLLDLDENELGGLKNEFSNMPSRSVILGSVIWGIIYIMLVYGTFNSAIKYFGFDNILASVIILEGLFAYLTGSAIYYHSFRQLGLVNRTVKMVKRFNLLQLDPVYAFSRVTSFIGVSWMIMLSLTLLTFPIQLISGLTLVILGLQLVMAVAAFILPLWFVHLRLRSQKTNLLSELNRQFESTITKLHVCLDKDDLGPVPQLKDALLGLSAERDVLNQIRTWPWSGSTLTGFLSATLLPIGLFIIQLVIQKLIGG